MLSFRHMLNATLLLILLHSFHGLQDNHLRNAVAANGPREWKKVSEIVFGSPDYDVQCFHRWQKVLNPKVTKGPWTKEEDDQVKKLVDRFGAKKWSLIASHLPGRIGKQCRER